MSRGSPPAIFHPPALAAANLSLYRGSPPFRSPTSVCISLPSARARLPLDRTPRVPSLGLAYIGPLPSADGVTNASAAASIMRATLSQRDQQRLNCIRDSRTAHKFSSLRRGFLLNTRPRGRRDSTGFLLSFRLSRVAAYPASHPAILRVTFQRFMPLPRIRVLLCIKAVIRASRNRHRSLRHAKPRYGTFREEKNEFFLFFFC